MAGATPEASFQIGHVVQVSEEHLHKDMVVSCKSKKTMASLRPHGFRRCILILIERLGS